MAVLIACIALVIWLGTGKQETQTQSVVAEASSPSNQNSEAEPDFYDWTQNLPLTQESDQVLQGHKITREHLTDLIVESGAVVATDPLVFPERPAFTRKIAPGRHPVTLYRDSYGMIALAELRISDAPVDSWEVAVPEGKSLDELAPGEVYMQSVDAGLSCFMDTTAQAAINERDVLEARAERYISYYDNVVAGEMLDGDKELDAISHQPMLDTPANVAIFQSGFGDGGYPSFWGLSAAGDPVSLVTDFLLIDLDEDAEKQEQ